MRKIYFKNLGLLLAGLFFTLTSNAAVGDLYYSDNVIYKGLNDTDVTVWGFTKEFAAETFTFPAAITSQDVTYNVVAISQFNGNTVIKNLTIPGTIKKIDTNWKGFTGCTALKTVTIEEGFKTLAKGAFSGCTSLETLTLPEGVTDIPPYAFQNCSSLKTITFPSSVQTIRTNSLVGCALLATVVCQGATPPTFTVDTDGKKFAADGVQLVIPAGADEAYASVKELFAAEVTAGIGATESSSETAVYANGKTISVANAKGEIAVYTVAGVQVAKAFAAGRDIEIPVRSAGMYVIKTANRSVKMIIK